MPVITQIVKWKYQNILKPLFFRFDPEFVHDQMLWFGSLLGKFALTQTLVRSLFAYQNPMLAQEIAGIKFANPVGLSAGFDKDANLTQIMPAVGFGFGQIGTVTNQPYAGNPKPRLYRLIKSKAIVVYYGLKNIGADKIIAKLKKTPPVTDFPVSISIGKTNCADTAEVSAGVEDYYQCLKKFHSAGIGDFYTINISCPNTFGGEPFTTADKLEKLMIKLDQLKISKPLFIKMPINLTWEEFKSLLDVAVVHHATGVIIGNLNKDHHDELVKDVIPKHIQGGISGKPTEKLSNELISKTYREYSEQLIIIGVGGIFSADDAYEKIKRGASLVQLITGMIFEGPQLIGEINRGLAELLKKDGYHNISEAVGTSSFDPMG